MHHEMKLNAEQFNLIKSGKKSIELRLNDEKRRNLSLNDVITFSKQSHLDEQLTVEVMGLLRYNTFRELIEDADPSDFGKPADYSKQKMADSMYEIYSKEDEKEYGVLGIRIRLLQ
jgi:ASC-1-like (ASCH) protein